MSKYKALITDLDGTLIPQNDPKGLPTLKVKETIEKARKKIHIGIATSRPPIYVDFLLEHLKLSGPSILLNGALIMDSVTKQILSAEKMDIKDFHAIIKILLDLHIFFTIDEVNHYAQTYSVNTTFKSPLVVFARNLTDEQVERVLQLMSHVSRLSASKVPDWTDKKRWALHICHVRATKQHAIVQIAEMLHISPVEIIGVGDGYNDFPLLMACGLKVAMGNAILELKAIADYIAPSIENDGVADVIEKFVLHE